VKDIGCNGYLTALADRWDNGFDEKEKDKTAGGARLAKKWNNIQNLKISILRLL